MRRQWPLIRVHWRVLLLLGVLGVGAHNALAYLGLNYTTATNGVILNSFAPVMIIALSWLFLRRRLSNVQLAGVMVSLAGVLTILAQGSLAQLLAFRLNLGDIFVILSMLLWSLYTICLRWRPPGLHTLAFLFVIACVGTTAILPFYVGEAMLDRQVEWVQAVVWRPYRSSKRTMSSSPTYSPHWTSIRSSGSAPGFSSRCRFPTGMKVDSLTRMG